MKLPNRKRYPKELLIGDETYSIKFVSKVDKGSCDVVGNCNPTTRRIRIKNDLSAADTFYTFIHEVLHAMEFEYEVDIKHSHIYMLEKAISDLFLQNF